MGKIGLKWVGSGENRVRNVPRWLKMCSNLEKWVKNGQNGLKQMRNVPILKLNPSKCVQMVYKWTEKA